MSDAARDRILARVREGLGAQDNDETRRAAVTARFTSRPRGTAPSRADGGAAAHLALFTRMAADAAATVASVKAAGDIPAAVTTYLQEHNLPAALRIGGDRLLAEIDWSDAPMLEIAHGPAIETDTTGLSVAAAAAAETGTVIMTAGADNPTTLNFLPETHIAIVPASRIHALYEDAWAALRRAYGEGQMPRVVNLITGPSRTADIEQTLLMGAHGPKRLHVILVEDA